MRRFMVGFSLLALLAMTTDVNAGLFRKGRRGGVGQYANYNYSAFSSQQPTYAVPPQTVVNTAPQVTTPSGVVTQQQPQGVPNAKGGVIDWFRRHHQPGDQDDNPTPPQPQPAPNTGPNVNPLPTPQAPSKTLPLSGQ
jgi:hypothetical protein